VAFALDAFSGTSAGSTSGAVSALAARRSRAPWLAVVAVAVAALGAGVLVDRALRPSPAPITFEPKTSDEQWITNARFAPDGQTIVYSATRYGDEHHPRLYVIRPGELTSQPVGGPGMHLLSVSSKGELAVLTNPKFGTEGVWRGTLARMTLDGAPRPWLEDVWDADWSADASTAAITRRTGNAVRLEYPIGRPLYELTHGYLSDPRVSPDGARVAFFEHPIAGDDRGWVKVVGASGAPRTVAGEFKGLKGLAWSGDGRSLYFSGITPGNDGYQPLVVNVDSTPRPHQAIASAGGMFVQDVAHDGGVLVMSDERRGSIRALVPGEVREREFSWLNVNNGGFLSNDAKVLVFGDESQSAGRNYAVGLQDLATSRVTRLGEGTPLGLSPDNKRVAALIPSVEQIVVYPIGPGDPIKLPKGSLEHYGESLQWFPDSQRVLVCGNEAGKAPRCYEQDLVGGLPRPVTPAGVVASYLANDGRTLLALKADWTYDVTMVGELSGRTAQGLTPDDLVIGWASNCRDLVVEEVTHEPTRVVQLDPSTGARRFLRTIGPSDRNAYVQANQWIADGRGYTYSYTLETMRLYVARGVGQ
jgi:hypothetical protein